MKKRYVADHLLTMDAACSIHSPGTVDVVNGVVAWSGSSADAPAHDDPVTVLHGLLMPGMVNAHAHTPMTLLRGAGEGLPTDAWLRDVMWPRESRLVEDDVRWAMRLGAAEMLGNGITTTSEMYFYSGAIADAAVDAGLRCIVAAPLIEAPEFAHLGSIDNQLADIATLRATWSDHPLIEIGVGPHSAYALSRDALAAVAEFAAVDAGAAGDDPMLIHIHVAEQHGEGDELLRATGLTVPAYLDDLGLLTTRTIGAHCVWMSADDIELFAARGVSVAHCPASNGRHASGIAPVASMRAAGIDVGLGTDGPASHDRLDMFEEMRMAVHFARVAQHEASALDARAALAMATSAAADALGRRDLGRLTAGARADMVLIDIDAAGYAPVLDAHGLIGRVVWAGSPASVLSVWVNGAQVVDGGRCVSIDRAEATAEVVARARRLAGA